MQDHEKLRQILDQLEKWVAEDCPHQDLVDLNRVLRQLRGRLARNIGTLRNASGLARERRIELLRPITEWYADNEALFPPQVVGSLNVITETLHLCLDDHTLRQIQQPDVWTFFDFHWRVVNEVHALVRRQLATLERNVARPAETIEAAPDGAVTVQQGDEAVTALDRGDASSFVHGDDYRSVNWQGKVFELTLNQAQVVQKLHEAHVRGTPALSDAHLLEGLAIQSKRLRDVFKGSSAWGTLVVPGKKRGTHRLDL